jgi:hypothetical protein
MVLTPSAETFFSSAEPFFPVQNHFSGVLSSGTTQNFFYKKVGSVDRLFFQSSAQYISQAIENSLFETNPFDGKLSQTINDCVMNEVRRVFYFELNKRFFYN